MTLDEMIAELKDFRRKHPEAGEWQVVSVDREGFHLLDGPTHEECVSLPGGKVLFDGVLLR